MVSNIDDNLGKLLRKIDELKIRDNTIVIFMTDNGPQQIRYVAGMRGWKGDVYRGGVRVPFYLRYPNLLEGSKDIETTAAHIDILPTLSQICNVELPQNRIIDGKNLLPLINDEQISWADRSLFFYWTRSYPELYNNMALQKGNYKLVGRTDYNSAIENFQLFNIGDDPYEQNNIVLKNTEIAQNLKLELDGYYEELINSENLLTPPRIIVGSKDENPVILNRNDAGGERGIWAQEEIYGKWRISIEEGNYDIKFKFIKPVAANGKMYLETNTIINQKKNIIDNTDIIEMKNVHLPKMNCDLIPFYSIGSKNIFPFWVEMKKLD
jgi:arylsulfatase